MRLWATIVLGVLALGGCKKAVTEAIAPDEMGVDLSAGISPVLMTPSIIAAQTPTPAQVVGTGFENGAQVFIGNTALSDVRFENENSLRIGLPAMEAGMYDIVVQNSDGDRGTIWQGLQVGDGGRGLIASRTCLSVVIHFETNGTGLSNANRAELNAQLGCWGEQGSIISIEGHADERGTTDYNLALGQRRADSVRRYLSQGGVALHNMTTLSVGEESPADIAHTEAAWKRNRRVSVGSR